MKILFMIPNLDGGGAEKVLVNLCNALMEQTKTEMKIDVLLLFDEGINRNSLSTKVTSIHCYRKKNSWAEIYSEIVFARKASSKLCYCRV